MHANTSTDMPERFGDVGKIAWLWMNSSLHRDWPMRLAAQFLLPPIAAGQFHLLERDGMPVAYCSWAWLDPEAELAYLRNPSRVLQHDWRRGDRLWFIDWVAPFGAKDSWHLRRAMMQRFPREVARAIRVKQDRKRGRVMEFKGPALPARAARERLDRCYFTTLQAARTGAAAGQRADMTAQSQAIMQRDHHG